jgi:hypothetical protein
MSGVAIVSGAAIRSATVVVGISAVSALILSASFQALIVLRRVPHVVQQRHLGIDCIGLWVDTTPLFREVLRQAQPKLILDNLFLISSYPH